MFKRFYDSKLGEFLSQDGYLFVFTFVCVLSLSSYFVSTIYFKNIFKQDILVVDSTSVKGVWVSSEQENCPTLDNVQIDRCVKEEYISKYTELNTKEFALDTNGRLLYSNDEIFVSGIFSKMELLNPEIWPNVYIGDLNIKINEKYYVYEDILWDSESDQTLLSVVKVDTGYILVLSPSVSMVGRNRQFWVYEYNAKSQRLGNIQWEVDENVRAFVESGDISFLENINGGIEIFLTDYDPSYIEYTPIEIYSYLNRVIHKETVLVVNGY